LIFSDIFLAKVTLPVRLSLFSNLAVSRTKTLPRESKETSMGTIELGTVIAVLSDVKLKIDQPPLEGLLEQNW
jgi:hypothetical protein